MNQKLSLIWDFLINLQFEIEQQLVQKHKKTKKKFENMNSPAMQNLIEAIYQF